VANNLPYMPLFVDDFDNDPEVQFITQEQEGLYLRLLRVQWREGELPADPARLRILCRHHAECFDRNWEALAHLFPEIAAGKLQNARLEIERARALQGTAARSERASKAAQARWGDKKPDEPKEPKAPAARIDWKAIAKAWNDLAVPGVDPISKMTDKRREQWRTRIESEPDLLGAIRRELPRLAGGVANSTWFAFDWILKNETNCAKFCEGKYKAKGNGSDPSGDLVWIGTKVYLIDGRGPVKVTSASGEKLWGKIDGKPIEFTTRDVATRSNA
jgi:uncharacterized protein YdaU (DUF1376 family)